MANKLVFESTLNLPEKWYEMNPFSIFLLGVIMTNPPYDTMTPEEVFADLHRKFTTAELYSGLDNYGKERTFETGSSEK